MKGDKLLILDWHRRIAADLVAQLLDRITSKPRRFVITVAGESGSGKSETARALADELANHSIASVILGQDDYFVLPPRSNDQKRRADPEWLGPHVEVRLDLMEQNLLSALSGASQITKPLVDYDANAILEETLSLEGVKVLIAEGTYTTLLRHVDARVFIARDWRDTLADRQARNRGNEAGDPFIERILSLEHMIIAPHQHLADFLITREHRLVMAD